MTFTILFYLSRLAVRAFQFHFKRSNPEIEYFILYHELPHRLKEKYILKCQLQRNVLATRICLGNHVSNTLALARNSTAPLTEVAVSARNFLRSEFSFCRAS